MIHTVLVLRKNLLVLIIMINTEFSMLDQVVPDDTTLQQRPPVYQVRIIFKEYIFSLIKGVLLSKSDIIRLSNTGQSF